MEFSCGGICPLCISAVLIIIPLLLIFLQISGCISPFSLFLYKCWEDNDGAGLRAIPTTDGAARLHNSDDDGVGMGGAGLGVVGGSGGRALAFPPWLCQPI